MPSNEEISNRIIEALSKKAPNSICPICKSKKWNVADGYIVLPVSPHPRELHLSGRVIPLVAVTCSNCGNTQLINLIKLGFKPEDFQDLRVDLKASENAEQKKQ